MTTDPLETLAHEQKRWSLTATRLKNAINRSRVVILALAIMGAVFEILGAQIHPLHPHLSVQLGYLGAAALGVIAVVRQWSLGRDRVQAWIVARAASESFKREMYLFLMHAGAYGGDSSGHNLYKRRDEILGKVRSAQRYVVEPPGPVTVPGPLDADGYIKERIERQIDWFRDRALRCARNQASLEGAQFALALAGALLGAALTMTGKQHFGAWVAVITTILGVLGTHVVSQRYEQLTVTYRATADRLGGIVGKWRLINGTPALLAEQCEAALLEENQGWIAGADEMLASLPSPSELPQSKPTPHQV